MKIHYATIFGPDKDVKEPACATGMLVRLGRDGTRFRKKVTCERCKKTRLFRGLK